MEYEKHQTNFEGRLAWIEVWVDREEREALSDGGLRNFVGVEDLAGCPVRGVHVIRPGHGEIRGYALDGSNTLRLRGPCYTGVWTKMDREVARVLGATVAPYEVDAGGRVTAAAGPAIGEQVAMF